MEEKIREFRVKIFDIRRYIIELQGKNDEKEKGNFIFQIKRVVHDLEKQANYFVDEYMSAIGTQDGFIGLLQAIRKAYSLETSSSLKELEDTDKKFSKVDAELLAYLRKHFGHIELEVKQVKVRGNLGGEYGGATGEVTMAPTKKDVYDRKN